MNLTVSPSITLASDELIEPHKLNLIATPKVSIAASSVSQTHVDSSYFRTSYQNIGTTGTLTWTMRSDWPIQFARTGLLTGNVTLDMVGVLDGMWGIITFQQSGATTYTVTADSSYVNKFAGGLDFTMTSGSPTNRKFSFNFFVRSLTIHWIRRGPMLQ